MTKAELIEQRVQQLIAQSWDREHAQADAERTYANYETAEVVEEAPKRTAKKQKVEAVAEPVEEAKADE